MSLRIGSINFPDTPSNDNKICYYFLDKVHPQSSIKWDEYYTNKLITIFNLERAGAGSDVLARGIDTNNKNLSLSLQFKEEANKPKPPTYIHVVMCNEMIIKIFNTHVDIME